VGWWRASNIFQDGFAFFVPRLHVSFMKILNRNIPQYRPELVDGKRLPFCNAERKNGSRAARREFRWGGGLHLDPWNIYPAALASEILTRGHSEAQLEEVYFLNATHDVGLPVREIANSVFRDFIRTTAFAIWVLCNTRSHSSLSRFETEAFKISKYFFVISPSLIF